MGREKRGHSWEVSGHQGSEELETEQSLKLERRETSHSPGPGTSNLWFQEVALHGGSQGPRRPTHRQPYHMLPPSPALQPPFLFP